MTSIIKVIYRTHVHLVEYFPEYLAAGFKSAFSNLPGCLHCVKQTSCENNERSEWKTLNALSESLTRTRVACCCKHILISIVVFMGWPFMYVTDL